MKRLASWLICAVLAVCFSPSHLLAAIAFVQSRSVSSGTVTSANLAFNSNNSAGSLIIVAGRVGAEGRTVTVSDSQGNSYSQVLNKADTNGEELFIVAAQNVAAGANTVTFAISGAAATIRWAIHEYSGLATSSAVDQTASALDASGGNSTPNSGNVTTTVNDELIFGAAVSGGDVTFTQGTGFTLREQAGSRLGTEDKILSATATTSASFTISGSGLQWAAGVATFKIAAGGGGGGPDMEFLYRRRAQ